MRWAPARPPGPLALELPPEPPQAETSRISGAADKAIVLAMLMRSRNPGR
jgi:hypothetical protein